MFRLIAEWLVFLVVPPGNPGGFFLSRIARRDHRLVYKMARITQKEC
jgi:hypothetical protein